MASDGRFLNVVVQLRSVRDELRGRLQELEVESKSLRTELDKTEAALQALSSKGRRTSSGSGVTVAVIAAEIAKVRLEEPEIAEEALRTKVLKRLKDGSNRKLSGFGLLFPKAMASSGLGPQTP